METSIYNELKTILAITKQKQEELNHSLDEARIEMNRGGKPKQDITRLMKMQMDNSRLQMQLLEKISKFAPPVADVPRAKATREDWEIVKNAVLRGEEPVWL